YRMNLAQAGIVKNKCFSFGSDAVNVPLRISSGNDVAIPIERHGDDMGFVRIVKRRSFSVRRHPIDGALVTGPDKQSSLFIEKQRPDVLGLRIEELLRHSIFDLVNLTVGRSPGIQDILVVHSKRKDIYIGEAHKHRPFSGWVDFENLAVMSGAQVNI